MSDWVIVVSFIFVEVWLLLLSLYVIRLRDRVKRDIDHAPLGVPGPPGPMGPMGMRGLDFDPTAMHELHSLLNQDKRRITSVEDRMRGLEELVWGHKASDQTRTVEETTTGSGALITSITAPKGVYVHIPQGSLNLPTAKEDPDGTGQPD